MAPGNALPALEDALFSPDIRLCFPPGGEGPLVIPWRGLKDVHRHLASSRFQEDKALITALLEPCQLSFPNASHDALRTAVVGTGGE